MASKELKGVVHVVVQGGAVRICDSGETRLILTRKEAGFLLKRLAEALIDAP